MLKNVSDYEQMNNFLENRVKKERESSRKSQTLKERLRKIIRKNKEKSPFKQISP